MLFEGVASSFNAANVRCKPPIWSGGVTGLNGSGASIAAGKELEAMIKNDLLKDADFKERKIMLVGGRGIFPTVFPCSFRSQGPGLKSGRHFMTSQAIPAPPPPPASLPLATLTRALMHVVLQQMDIA